MRGKILLLLTVLIIFVVFGIILLGHKGEKIVTPLGKNQETKTEPINLKARLKIYEDPAGFLFKYPENLTVKINKINDQSVFSSLTLTSKSEKGNITIEAVTSNLQNLEDWLSENKIPSNRQKIKLADIDAISFEQTGKVITTALDIGTLLTFTVDYQKNKNYWLDVNKTILSTFAFSAPEEAPAGVGDSPADEDIIFEGEEVIE